MRGGPQHVQKFHLKSAYIPTWSKQLKYIFSNKVGRIGMKLSFFRSSLWKMLSFNLCVTTFLPYILQKTRFASIKKLNYYEYIELLSIIICVIFILQECINIYTQYFPHNCIQFYFLFTEYLMHLILRFFLLVTTIYRCTNGDPIGK